MTDAPSNLDIERAKIRLAGLVANALLSQGLTQAEAAELLGIDQPGVSHLANGRVERFSIERLIRFLNVLDRDVEIRVRAKPRDRRRGRVRIVRAAGDARPCVGATSPCRRRRELPGRCRGLAPRAAR